MKGRTFYVVILCQVIALSVLEQSAGAEFNIGSIEVTRITSGSNSRDDSCPCAKSPTVGRSSKSWTKDNLDKLTTWISRVVGSLNEEELDGPVVVLPLVINGNIEETIGISNNLPESRIAPVDIAALAESTAPANSTALADKTAPAEITATPYTLLSSYITVLQDTATTVATTPHIKDSLEVCTQSKDRGPCRMLMRQWYYNATSGDCAMFIYGGCKGNDNRFLTRSQCLDFCSGVGLEKVEMTVYSGAI